MKKKNYKKKGSQSNFSKLSVFQNNKYKFKKKCPLSGKGAPIVDYKNIKLLKRYVSENGKILPSRITSVSQKKQRELSLSIKRARNLALRSRKQAMLRRKIHKANRKAIKIAFDTLPSGCWKMLYRINVNCKIIISILKTPATL